MRRVGILTLLSCFPFSGVALAASFAEVPTNWQVINGMGNVINVYYTKTTCADGRLRLGANATDQDKNRFWSTIMAAKLSNNQVIVYYDPTLPDCQLTDFGLK